MIEFGWRDIGEALGLAAIVGGMVIAWVRWQLSSDFARKGDIEGLSSRVQAIETAIVAMPTHDDVRKLTERVAKVESGVEVASARIEGVREGVGRIERDLHILMTHQMAPRGRDG